MLLDKDTRVVLVQWLGLMNHSLRPNMAISGGFEPRIPAVRVPCPEPG